MTQSKAQQELLRELPQVEEVLNSHLLVELRATLPHEIMVDGARAAVDAWRQDILAAAIDFVDVDRIAEAALQAIRLIQTPSLRSAINATGVIVHTNLGRSVLAEEAVEAVTAVARNYSTLEYDVQTCDRGSRHAHCEKLICLLTGAEAAIAVNNNAAAVMMVLSEFASEHEAIVSRGELVEIGGSFRVPDIMELSRATMVEVGTTNKTHLADYENALTPDTAMLLKVHPSNYRMVGFTESVNIKDLRKLADEENRTRTQKSDPSVLVYEDQGSGALIRLDCFGSYAEPAVSESLQQGCDLVSFSGDKLLGGPQAGIIAGRKDLIARLKKNPLARALRLDKMTLAALEATLRLYFDKDEALRSIPTLHMLSMSTDEAQARATELAKYIEHEIVPEQATCTIEPEISRAGGGALPMCDIDTFVVSLRFKQGNALECERFLIQEWMVPIVARIKKESLLFDARTILRAEDYQEIAQALKAYFETGVQ